MRVALVLLLVLAGLAALLFWPQVETRSVVKPPGEEGEAIVQAASGTATLVAPEDENDGVEPAEPTADRRVALQAPVVEPEAPTYRVLVVDEQKEAVEGATVFLYEKGWRGTEAWDRPPKVEARTTVDGVARLEGDTDGLDELLVFAPDRLPVCVKRSSQTEDVVTLIAGRPLSGRVTVDGQVPGEAFELEVRGFRDESASWSTPAQKLVASLGIGRSRAACTVDANGEFTLLGLHPEESVTFVVPDDFRFLDPVDPDEPRWSATIPVSQGVLLELTRLAAIVGRPVSVAEPKPPAEGELYSLPDTPAEVTIVYTFRNEAGEAIRESSETCATGTPFSLPAPEGAMRAEVLLKTNWFGGEILAQRTVDGPFFGEHDLGDIPIDEAGQSLVLRVVDQSGAPIEGAQALLSGKLSEATDEDGRTELERRPEDQRLVVGARGFELASIELPSSPPQPFVVTLGTTNSIRLELLPAIDGMELNGLRVYLSLPGGMTDDMPEMHGSFAEANGAVPGGGMWSSDERTHVYELDSSGILERFNLPTETEITIAVLDRYENDILEEKLTLGPHERRELVRRLPVEARVFHGRVIDEEGRPVRDAQVATAGFFGDSPDIGEDGGFRMENIYTDEPHFWIRSEGYVELELTGWEELSRSPFVLLKGRTVWVEITGLPEQVERISVRLTLQNGKAFTGRRMRDGLFEFGSVPYAPGLVTAEYEGRAGEAPLAASSDRVTIHF